SKGSLDQDRAREVRARQVRTVQDRLLELRAMGHRGREVAVDQRGAIEDRPLQLRHAKVAVVEDGARAVDAVQVHPLQVQLRQRLARAGVGFQLFPGRLRHGAAFLRSCFIIFSTNPKSCAFSLPSRIMNAQNCMGVFTCTAMRSTETVTPALTRFCAMITARAGALGSPMAASISM